MQKNKINIIFINKKIKNKNKMSSNEEPQALPSLSDLINSEKNVKPIPDNLRMSLAESKQVNEKITELISERHSNDINEGKDDNDTQIRNKSFLDRLKKRGKDEKESEEKLEDMIINKENKENEPITTLTTLNDVIEEKKEENDDNKEEKEEKEEVVNIEINKEENNDNSNEIKEIKEIEEENKIEIKEEKIPEKEEENIIEIQKEIKEEKPIEEIKEEIIESKNIEKAEEESLKETKIEIKSISNKSKSHSKSKSKSNSKSKASDKKQGSLYSNKSDKSNSIKVVPKSQQILKKNLQPKSSEKRNINKIIKKNKTFQKPKQVIKINKTNTAVIKETKKRKFDEEKFKKELEFFKQCEQRKKEKIEKLKQDKIKKEIESINNKKNIHYRKKLPQKKLPDFLERIYTRDLEKRKEKKQILTKIYTPSFTPFLYTKGNITTLKKKQPNEKQQYNNLMTNYTKTIEEPNEENMTYNQTDIIYNDAFNENKMNRGNSSQKSQRNKKKVKFNMEENNEALENIDENEEIVPVHNRDEVENAYRSKLFSRGGKLKRNKSAEMRKKLN